MQEADYNSESQPPTLDKSVEFTQLISNLISKAHQFDQSFLDQVTQVLQLKNQIQTHEVTSIAIAIVLAAVSSSEISLPLQIMATASAFKKIEQLQKIISQQDIQISINSERGFQLAGWISKIWDRLMHFSSFKNYTDMLVLYASIGHFLFEPEWELKRLSKLMLQSANKLKVVQNQTIQMTQKLIKKLLQLVDAKKYSNELKIKLKIINFLFVLKSAHPNERQLVQLKICLYQIYQQFLQHLIDSFQRLQQNCIAYEQQIIWDKLFSSLLLIISRYPDLQQISKKILLEMINHRIDMQTVKLLIKQLQITNQEQPTKKWKQIFGIIDLALKQYDVPKECLLFLTNRSFIKIPISTTNNFLIQIEVKNCLKTFREEKMLFMLQDKNRNQELWITMRNINEAEILLILLKVSKSIISEKVQKQLKWQQNKSNTFYIDFTTKQIKISLSHCPQSQLSIQNFINGVSSIVIGDEDSTLGTPIRMLFSYSIYSNSKREGGQCVRLDMLGKSNRGIRKKILASFVDLIKAVGDLDIFLLVISHAIKKIKKNQSIVEMIRLAVNLLEHFVEIKRVKQVKVSAAEREERMNAILCLCWQCSHQTQNALAILQLLRVLSIRGVNNPEDQLQILCNFVFWKHFDWQYQRLIIFRIKQLFRHIHNLPNYLKMIHKYCQRMLIQTALYYRQDDITHVPESKDQILKIHYQFISMMQHQMQDQVNSRKQPELYYQFIQFILKLLGWTLNRRNSILQVFDLTLSLQLSLLVRTMTQLTSEWKIKDQKLLRVIKQILQVCAFYQSEEKYYEQKTIRIFKGDSTFQLYEQSIIKQNLYFLAFQIANIKPTLLNSLIQLDERGIPQITCIAWQKLFFQQFIINFDQKKIYFQQKSQKVQSLRNIFELLPLKCLSNDQNKLLARIYIINDKFFPHIDFKIIGHLTKVLAIKDLLNIMQQELKCIARPLSEITAVTKINQTFDFSFKQSQMADKILALVAYCKDLNCEEGMTILRRFELMQLGEYKLQKKNLLVCHFTLKGLVQKTKDMFHDNPASTIFVQSLMNVKDVQQKSAITQDPSQFVLSRSEMINCLQYYLTQVNLKEIMSFQGIGNFEEGESHLRNFKINIECIMNHVSTFEINSVQKLKYFYHFLQERLLPLSKYLLEQYKIIPFRQQIPKKVRKGSKDQIQFPKMDFKQQAKNMFTSFIDQRNFNLLKVEKVWSKLQQKNKYFWTTFIAKQTYYSLFQGTGSCNERYLLRKDTKKPKLELPKMLKTSIMKSNSIMSVISDKFDFNQNESVSSIFDDAPLYRKEPTSCLGSSYQNQSKETYHNKRFKVLLITSSKIYQGKVIVSNKKIYFVQNQEIIDQLYDKIFASQCEKRSEDECIRQNYKFQQELSSKCVAIVKRYLYHDLAVQLHTKNRSYLFSFIRRDHRQAFLCLLQKQIKVIHRQKLQEEVKAIGQKWQNGILSNFQYLMKLNDLTGRSLNDLSQYYVFPWTVTNYQQQMDLPYFQNKDNFRNLTLPVGKLSKDKWESIKKRFQSKKQQKDQHDTMPLFLFGSFYSNRAIVCNLMIRINPFTSQHYQLQSLQFDSADRLFFSITQSYKSMMSCSSDFKQLIPEFYYFPEFLKNRSSYNLGYRQNKDVVHNVALPCWAKDQYQFIFKMRKAFQSQIVTTKLNCWIDLIFGVYAKKQNALKADNLFLGDLYRQGFIKYLQEKDKSSVQMFKQFGQVPVPVIQSNHFPSKFQGNYLDSINHPTFKIQQYSLSKISQTGKLLQISFYQKFIFLLFQKQIRLYEQQKFNDKDFVFVNGQFEGSWLRAWQMNDIDDKKHLCILVYKRKAFEVIAYEIRKNIWQNFCFDGGQTFPFLHKCQMLTIYQNFILTAQGKSIFIYKNIKQDMNEEYSNKLNSLNFSIGKGKYLLEMTSQFTQHKSKISYLYCSERGMVISVDQDRKVFIIQISSSNITIFNFFQIKNTYFEQQIVDMQIHNMAFIILRTDYDRIIVYSFLGDLVLAKHLNFTKNIPSAPLQKPMTMAIWNHQLFQMVIGTNTGNLWKIDLFQLRRRSAISEVEVWMEKIYLNREGFRKQGLFKMAVNRIGRHSITVIYAQNNKMYVVKSQKWEQARRQELLGKKVVNFW